MKTDHDHPYDRLRSMTLFNNKPALVLEIWCDLKYSQSLISPSGIWTLAPDYSCVRHTNRATSKDFGLTDLRLSQGDSIHFIDFIEEDKTIFIYATRGSTPTGFFVTVSGRRDHPFPRVRSFALNSLHFHERILAAFNTRASMICVVSREGATIHNMDLICSSLIELSVSQCRFSGSHLLILAEEKSTLLLYNLCNDDGVSFKCCCFQRRYWTYGLPDQFVVLSHSFVLGYSSPAMLRVIPRNASGDPTVVEIALHWFSTESKVFVYDDALFITNRSEFGFFDLRKESMIPIGEISLIPTDFQGIFESRLAVAGMTCFRITPAYDVITSQSGRAGRPLIAALFRRADGLSTATALLMKTFNEVKSIEGLKKLVEDIGPSARSPAAQVRFARAIQFSGLVNPHMILLGLLHYRKVLGDEITEEAKIPLFEAMFHPRCRHTMSDFFMGSGEKLKQDALKVVMQRYGGEGVLPLEVAPGIKTYQAVCETLGNSKQANVARLIADLNNGSLDD
jgi:hypothetical protein